MISVALLLLPGLGLVMSERKQWRSDMHNYIISAHIRGPQYHIGKECRH